MRRAFSILWFFWLLQWSATVTAQVPFSFDQPTVIDDRMGLPSNQVNALIKDQTGFIWIGTQEGLARFDGHRFEIFQHDRDDQHSIPSNYVECLLADHLNRIWVGTIYGLVRYREASNDFVPLPDPRATPESRERILSIYQDEQDIMWIGTPTRLRRYDPKCDSLSDFQFTVQFPDTTFDIARINSIQYITQDKKNTNILWLGSLSGLIKFNRQNHQYDWYPNTMPDKNREYLANAIRTIHPLSTGELLVGSWNGAYLFSPVEKAYGQIFAEEPERDPLFRSLVLSFLELPDHQGIGITYSNGFCWYRPESRQVNSVFLNNHTENKVYSALMVDSQQRVWGLSDRGVYLYNPLVNRIKSYTFPVLNQLQPILPRTILPEAGSNSSRFYLAALAFNGLISWDPADNTWSIIPPPPGESWESGIQDLIRLKNGRTIIVGHHELYELLEPSKRIVPLFPEIDFGSPAFRKAIEGQSDELWVASRRAGLFRLNLSTGQLKIYTEELDKIPGDNRHRWIETLYKDSHEQIWIRTAFEYSVYKPQEDAFFHWDSYGRDSLYNFPVVQGFQEDRNGNMWLAGDQYGLGMASVKDVDRGVIKIITGSEGLPDGDISNIGMDHQGYLWLEHKNGISRFQPETGATRYFHSGYGVPRLVDEFIIKLPKDRLALSIPDGIAVFRPEDLIHNDELPVPYLTSFKVFDREQSDLGAVQVLDEIRLSYKQNFFSFEFSALAFNLPEQVNFRYRLSGFDHQWNQAGNRRFAAYTNIPGGDYVFELEAANNEGIWNQESLQVPIHITTPWWKTLWFWFSSGSFALASVVFAVRWRIKQVRQQEKIKSEFDKKLVGMELHALRAQMNPHFIFNCLNSIDYYIIKNETEKASDYLNRFSRLIRLILQNSRAEYVNLKDELEALKLYMEMESLRFDDRFEYVVRVGSGLPLESLEIPPLLLQPYVENAIWHGLAKKSEGKNRLDLTITRKENLLYCRIEDNGIGREAARQMKSAATGKHRSMGMYLTRDRLHLINRMHSAKADVEITDLKDDAGNALGTRVDIIIPLR